MEVLIICDMQNKFVDGINGAKAIVPEIEKLANESLSFGETVVFLQSVDNLNDISKESEIIPELADIVEASKVIKLSRLYYAPITDYLEDRYPDKITLCGCRTEQTILPQVVICKSHFPEAEIIVHEDKCVGESLSLQKSAFDLMNSWGITKEPPREKKYESFGIKR